MCFLLSDLSMFHLFVSSLFTQCDYLKVLTTMSIPSNLLQARCPFSNKNLGMTVICFPLTFECRRSFAIRRTKSSPFVDLFLLFRSTLFVSCRTKRTQSSVGDLLVHVHHERSGGSLRKCFTQLIQERNLLFRQSNLHRKNRILLINIRNK